MRLLRFFLVIASLPLALPHAPLALGAGPVVASISPRIRDAVGAEPAPGKFLVARRSLEDPHFRKSVIYILQHDVDGTLGLVLNRPGDVTLSDAVADVDPLKGRHHPLYLGGPVGIPQITMLIANPPAASMARHIAGNIYFSADRALLDQFLDEGKPESELRFYLGYAGWGPGQLTLELVHQSWHMIQAEDTGTVFDRDIRTLWQRLIQSLDPTGIQVHYGPRYNPATAIPAGT